MTCTNCGVTKATQLDQWWGLSNYFGISGKFCPNCYELVSHDPYLKPSHPAEYAEIKAKQEVLKELT